MHSNKLYIGITKSKSPALFIVDPSIFVMQLVNGAQFLNVTQAAIFPAIVVLTLNRN